MWLGGAGRSTQGGQASLLQAEAVGLAGVLAVCHAHVVLDLHQLFLGTAGAAGELLKLVQPLRRSAGPAPQQVPAWRRLLSGPAAPRLKVIASWPAGLACDAVPVQRSAPPGQLPAPEPDSS